MVKNNNSKSCEDYFWSKPINNVKETKALLEKTSCNTKGRYISEPLNVVKGSQMVDNLDGTKTEKISSKEIFLDK